MPSQREKIYKERRRDRGEKLAYIKSIKQGATFPEVPGG